MNRTELIAHLRSLNACVEALAWIKQTPGEPDDLWAACQRGDWLLWLLVAVGYDERTMRHIACDCAEGVLPIYERAHPDDRRPRDAIAVARRYADGAATYDELIAASDAASDAARGAAWAAARAASWAAARAAARAAADAAAKAAAWATARAASWDAAMSRHADMIRARVSWADVEAQLTTRGACECGADDVCALARRAQEAEVRADEQAAELHRLLKALTGLVTEIEALIAESHGVAGLHLNGDVATWDELEPGGRFERLASLADARAAIAALEESEVAGGR